MSGWQSHASPSLETPDIPIERRVQLRKAAVGARIAASLVVITPDELEALLDIYEQAGGRKNTWTNRPFPTNDSKPVVIKR